MNLREATVDLIEERVKLLQDQRAIEYKDLTYCNELATRIAECQMIIMIVEIADQILKEGKNK